MIFICTVLLWMLLRAHRTAASQREELGRLCDALWAEVKDDKVRTAEKAKEVVRLSEENAAMQLDFYSRDHIAMADVVRVPQEVCVTEHGRCYHHRSALQSATACLKPAMLAEGVCTSLPPTCTEGLSLELELKDASLVSSATDGGMFAPRVINTRMRSL